jgi:hypothetical protein
MGGTLFGRPFFVRARALAFASLLTVAASAPVPDRGQNSTDEHLEEPGWWPRQTSDSLEEYAGSSACKSCHEAIAAEQETTPMARTLLHAEAGGVLRSHGQLNFHNGKYAYKITMDGGKPELSVTDGISTLAAPLLWAFGTGQVGQSYLFQRNGNYFESRVSYFGALENLNFTPARALLSPYDLEEAMARPVDPGEIRRCFSCHSTASVIAGKFEPSKLVAGITCEACHGPGVKHANAMEASVLQGGVGDEQAANLIFDPGKLNPNDSVDFCGACHGTWVDAVRAGIKGLPSVRLQPYRLQNSKCWGRGDRRITCVACHDPHLPLVEELSAYDGKCLNCHLATPSSKSMNNHPGPACPVGTKNCVSCHMPKIEVPETHHAFVDHEIRIVRPGHPLPD